MKPHAFIAMPFGSKPGPAGQAIDFNRVLDELIRPALEAAGCEVFRADEEMRAGDIRVDMFQELLVADLVVADLTLANANVWYELGVRHALRARGVVLMYGADAGWGHDADSAKAFDTYTERKLRYHLASGVPDPATLQADVERLATMARETLATSTRRKVSPVYALLPHLQQPQWHKLLLADANEFSDTYNDWARRMEVARQRNRPGDIMTLANETPTRALALEAKREAGNSLLKLQQAGLALEQFDAALAIDPEDLQARQKKATCLGRLGRFEEAREWTQALTHDHPSDAECWALAGRVEKDGWIGRWHPAPGAAVALAPGALKDAAALEDASLGDAISPYRSAFMADPSHHYSGINALMLTVLRVHLGGDANTAQTEALLGGVRWAVASALAHAPRDYWARASQAMLSLLCFDAGAVQRDFRAAAAAADRDWFALDSSLQSLALLRDVGFRPAETALAIDVVEREIKRLAPPFVPRQVLLFSGHMVDAPDRADPRFPAALESAAAREIGAAIDSLGAGNGDLALCQCAAGGDILFLEAAQARGIRCQIMLPSNEPEYIQRSILPSADGASWRERWFAVRARLPDPPRLMPEDLGPNPRGLSAYERCNDWLTNTALAWGPDKTRFLCLWNGAGGDGPGGTQHMMDEVKRRTGRVKWIDTRTLS
ncbi:MAG TPA: tetratricopeptide repeat protein [Ideonella sp.]|uniref:tetratricopeptide repeat protein n=1 Tax=Ideonella sp. TaxID=1929293 RepID=UPI002E2EEBD7|nr:tetratricopeptide repeat protein [Ideonella sp.]HEX5687952.1 tetratricopeptide repeat protein [Ideonella sp.]